MKTILSPLVLMLCLSILIIGCKKKTDPIPTHEPCDKGIALTDQEAISGAKAIGLCDMEDGFVGAFYTRANGTALVPDMQIGIMEKFGPNMLPREGERMLVMSTGRARTAGQPGFSFGTTVANTGIGGSVAGIPVPNPACPPSTTIYDDIVFELDLKAPANALGFSIDLAFYSFEYPNWLCSQFNDQFVIKMNPEPSGAVNGNLVFDSDGAPMSANTNFMDSTLTAELVETGFGTAGDGATTGWLRLTVPVSGGQAFNLKCFLFEVGDNTLYSSVLLDNFKWLTQTTTLKTEKL